MNNLHRLKNNMKMNKNEEPKSLIIENVPELVEGLKRCSGGRGWNYGT
jgi:hypothetical protein